MSDSETRKEKADKLFAEGFEGLSKLTPMASDQIPSNNLDEFKKKPPKDQVLELMRARGLALTRANYLDLVYPDGVPALTAEILATIPEELKE